MWILGLKGYKSRQIQVTVINSKPTVTAGCKESRFYSLPFWQAVASMYQPTSHFKQYPETLFDQQNWLQSFCNLNFPKKQHLPNGQVKNKNHQPDSKIHQPWAIRHDFLCTLDCGGWVPCFCFPPLQSHMALSLVVLVMLQFWVFIQSDDHAVMTKNLN